MWDILVIEFRQYFNSMIGFHANGRVITVVYKTIGGVAQLVVASSLMLKAIGFDPGWGNKYS